MKADKEFTENYAHGLVHLLRAGSRAVKIGVLDEKKFMRLTREGLRETALALIEAGYNQTEAAEALDIPRTTLRRAIHEPDQIGQPDGEKSE